MFTFNLQEFLNRFPIEGLHSVVYNFELHRVSSLNKLYEPKDKIRFKRNSTAVLFGGLDYNLNDDNSNSFPSEPLYRGAIYKLPFLYGTKLLLSGKTQNSIKP